MADKLGITLVRKGLLTQAQLDQGLGVQLIHGGRLGTRLVELGFLDIETVGMVLGELTHFPVAMEADFDAVTEATLKLLTADQAEKHQAFPLAVEGRRLKVAMANPLELQTTDALGFITGMRIVPYVTPELRLFQYQARHYGIDRPHRALPAPAPVPIRRSVSVATVPLPPMPAPAAAAAPVRPEPQLPAMFGGLAPGQFLSDDSDDSAAEDAVPEIASASGLSFDSPEEEELPQIVMGEPVRPPPGNEAFRPGGVPMLEPARPPVIAPAPAVAAPPVVTAQPPGMVVRQGGPPVLAGPGAPPAGPGGAPARAMPPPGAPGSPPPGMVARGAPGPVGARPPSVVGIPAVGKPPPPGMRAGPPGGPGPAMPPRPPGPPGAPLPPGMVRAGPPPGPGGMPPGMAPRPAPGAPPPGVAAPAGAGPVPPGPGRRPSSVTGIPVAGAPRPGGPPGAVPPNAAQGRPVGPPPPGAPPRQGPPAGAPSSVAQPRPGLAGPGGMPAAAVPGSAPVLAQGGAGGANALAASSVGGTQSAAAPMTAPAQGTASSPGGMQSAAAQAAPAQSGANALAGTPPGSASPSAAAQGGVGVIAGALSGASPGSSGQGGANVIAGTPPGPSNGLSAPSVESVANAASRSGPVAGTPPVALAQGELGAAGSDALSDIADDWSFESAPGGASGGTSGVPVAANPAANTLPRTEAGITNASPGAAPKAQPPPLSDLVLEAELVEDEDDILIPESFDAEPESSPALAAAPSAKAPTPPAVLAGDALDSDILEDVDVTSSGLHEVPAPEVAEQGWDLFTEESPVSEAPALKGAATAEASPSPAAPIQAPSGDASSASHDGGLFEAMEFEDLPDAPPSQPEVREAAALPAPAAVEVEEPVPAVLDASVFTAPPTSSEKEQLAQFDPWLAPDDAPVPAPSGTPAPSEAVALPLEVTAPPVVVAPAAQDVDADALEFSLAGESPRPPDILPPPAVAAPESAEPWQVAVAPKAAAEPTETALASETSPSTEASRTELPEEFDVALVTDAEPPPSAPPVLAAEPVSVEPASTALPVTTEPESASKALAVSTANSEPVSEVLPVTTAESESASTALATSTANSEPVSEVLPITTAESEPASKALPVTTAASEPASTAPAAMAVEPEAVTSEPAQALEDSPRDTEPQSPTVPEDTAPPKPRLVVAPAPARERTPISLDDLPASSEEPMQLASTWEFVGWQGGEGEGPVGHSAETTWADRVVDLEVPATSTPAASEGGVALASAWEFMQHPWQPQASESLDTAQALLAAASASTDTPPNGPTVTADQVLSALDTADSQGMVGKVLLAYSAGRFRRAFLLGDSFGLARVGRAWGPGSERPEVTALKVDLDAPSLLASALKGPSPSVFNAPQGPQDEAIFSALCEAESHLLVFPLHARGQPVAFFVAENGPAPVELDMLEELGRIADRAVEICTRLHRFP
ncbi:hypothetical protein [Corallococcus sp. BB11-1]|uniref:GspE/PulE/PilB domain-containing protein n=1 Tax=Corallococcus sp. BB11-1 TaxID=2996783 RepID=UPI002D1E3796|nr:hypothetical protein [Corallococcus sp. BB11-1]